MCGAWGSYGAGPTHYRRRAPPAAGSFFTESGLEVTMKPKAREGTGIGLVLKALSFAAHKHRDQKRKDAEASPYINHPIAVAEIRISRVRLQTRSQRVVAV